MGLEAFIQAARDRIARGAYAMEGEALPSHGSLVEALEAPAAVIAELKPASPSRGRLLQGPATDIIEAYVAGGAAALSVLADADHFGGSPALVRQAHAAGRPILWKDFVIDWQQIQCAAHNGASAVLLIERLFDDRQEREALVEAAHDAGLEVMLEVHGLDEAAGIAGSAADIVGVNARDLETLEVDLAGAREVIDDLAGSGGPVVALSGIRCRTDRLEAEIAGASAVLVGTHLMLHPYPDLALKALRRPLAKVCGIRDPAALDDAAKAGADLVGFIVGVPDSPRDLTPIAAQGVRDQAREQGLRTVLVTSHADAYEVREWCRLVRPDFVQLHGLEVDDAWVHSLGAVPTQVLHAMAPDDAVPETGLGLVLDSPSRHGTGGAGETHDWKASAQVIAARPDRFTLIAGGLDAGNVAAALETTAAWGADASSGLESELGIKDPKKVAAFVQAVHEVA